MDRRSFVKRGAFVAAGAAAGALGYAGFRSLRGSPIPGPRTIDYVGARRTRGPAKRGIPMLPLRASVAGALEGDPSFGGRFSPASVLDSFRYCGNEAAPALRTDYGGDDALTFHVDPDATASGYKPWYADRNGQAIHATDFPGEGAGALALWRSEPREGAVNVHPVVVIFVGHDPSSLGGIARSLKTDGVPANIVGALEAQIRSVGCLAYGATCPHFCCTMEWKGAPELERAVGAENQVFCTCHFVACDPYDLTLDRFVLPPST